MKKQLLFSFFLFFTLFSLFGQNHKIDSLKNELIKNKNNLEGYKEIITHYTDLMQMDSIKKYTFLYYKDSDRYGKNNQYGSYVESILFLTNYYYLAQDVENYNLNLERCINLSAQLKDKRIWASCHFLMARINYNNSESQECINNSLKALSYYEPLGIKAAVMTNGIYVLLIMSYKNIGKLELANNYLIKQKKIVKDADLKYQEGKIGEGEIAILDAQNRKEDILKVRLKLINTFKNYDHEYSKIQGLTRQYFNVASYYLDENSIEMSKKYLDSSKLYLNQCEKSTYNQLIPYFANLETEILLKEEKLNIKSLDSIKSVVNKSSEKFNIAKTHSTRASYFKSIKDYKASIEEYENAKYFYIENGFKKEYGKTLKQLIELNILIQDSAKATLYLNEYEKNNESYLNDEIINSISSANIRYETELKETQIAQQNLQIEKETNRRNIAIGSGIFILFLSGGIFYWFRNKQKQKELKTQNVLLSLEQNLNQMELAQLNQQLDPHEIKNLLASISPEIQEKAPDSYRKMLKLFNITKASLNGSLTESVENQVKQVEDYLLLTQNTMTEPLEFEIQNHLKNEEQRLPRLILKNLVENAVKHGIKGNEIGGRIIIELIENNGFLNVSVDDTGTGRKQAISLDSGIGISTYQKLFETLNQSNKEKASFEIIDKEQGTRVEVRIPINYTYNQTV